MILMDGSENIKSKDGQWGGRVGGCLEETRPLGEHNPGNFYYLIKLGSN